MDSNLKRFIKKNELALVNSKKDLKSIFEIMFDAEDNILCEGNDGFRIYKLTYREIKEQILRAAAGLYLKIGATHSFVALEMENDPLWIVGFWAILASGNKPYLVNMRYPLSLTQGILTTLDIKYVICKEGTKLSAEGIDINSLLNDAPTPPEDVFEDELAFSSSATSMNEVVCFYNGYQIAEQILNFKSIIKENPRMAKHYKGSLKQLAFLPFYHVFGLFAVYFWFTFFGRTLVFLRDYSAETIIKTCKRHAVTHIFAVPMLWHTIEKQLNNTLARESEKTRKKFTKGIKAMEGLQNLFPSFGPEIAKNVMKQVTSKLFGNSICFCINGGSYVRDSALKTLNGIGYSLHNGYGMSEIGITSVELRNKPKLRNLNSIGRPFDSVEYKLDDNGTLLVKGSSLCTKKLKNGEPVEFDGWFNTGDRMEMRDGYYYILGRNSDVVIGENGENINPDTIEQRFNISGAKMLCVLGLKSGESEELSIVVQINPYISNEGINKIIDEVYAVNETIPTASAIKKFYFTFDDLAPPTAVKVSRAQLIKNVNEKRINLTAFSDMKATAENADEINPVLLSDIKIIIANVLGINPEEIGPDSHIIFDLGGTSIQYFSIISAISEKFNITSYDKEEKYRYTPREICKYIERNI